MTTPQDTRAPLRDASTHGATDPKALQDARIDAAIDTAIDTACARVAPTWPLDRFIAVNPLWGYVDLPVPDASAKLAALTGSTLVMDRAWYREAWRTGRVSTEHLEAALTRAGGELGRARLVTWLDAPATKLAPQWTMLDVADAGRTAHPTFRAHVVDAISRHCASHFDPRAPGTDGLFASWRRAAAADLDLASSVGIHDRAVVEALPRDPRRVIARALDELDIAADARADYLSALLLDVGGWAAWCAYRGWTAGLSGSEDPTLVELLAIRAAWELRLLRHLGPAASASFRRARIDGDAREKEARDAQREAWIWQDAVELAYQRALARQLAEPPSKPGTPSTPRTEEPVASVQAAFCIDVRSEVFRRALEKRGPQTLGFAGFFGMPIEYLPLGATSGRPQLPGLLGPTLRATDVDAPAGSVTRRRTRLDLARAWRMLKSGPLSTFAYVDAVGPFHAASLLARTFGSSAPTPAAEHEDLAARERGKPRLTSHVDGRALDLDTRVELAAGMLRAMSLTKRFARLVVFVGHGSATRNNPHASGLDCGACCGQTGEVNARAAAALLNDVAVRRGLRARGVEIPESTHFVAALHVTTTDDVQLFDLDELPASHAADVATLQAQLEAAGVDARAERATRLGLDATTPRAVDAAVRKRAGDWSEVRPEWGLARNAAFVIAPRTRTRHVSLDGRAFLHEYVAAEDPGFAILEGILTAPMVVTHWINFQYYASTVDPRRFGSGNKVLHDVVGGTLGVLEGNGGDLRIGLPLQSLHDGARWVHEPLRLSVFVEAPEAAIDAILARHAKVRALVDHGWLHLFRLEPGAVFQRRGGQWERVPHDE